MKKRITFVIGTRPELIKVSKVVNYLKSQNRFKVSLISSQQQVKLLKQNMSNEDEIDLFLNIKSKKSDQDFISKLLICLDIEFKNLRNHATPSKNHQNISNLLLFGMTMKIIVILNLTLMIQYF